MKREAAFLIAFLIILAVSLFSAIEVQSVKASGTIYIRADGGIDPRDAPISTIDNVTYTLTGNITGDYGSALLVERDNIVIDGSAHTIDGVPEIGIGIWMNGNNNVTIRNVNITNFRTGIYLVSCSLISINANTIERSYLCSIGLYSCSLISIYGNILAHNWEGIWVDSSSGNTISANNVTNNGHYGIFLDYSSNNSISGNEITNDGDIYYGGGGIHLSSSSNNSIAGNNIIDNSYDGIELSSSTNNSISENTIANNGPGIILSQYYGEFTLGPLPSFNSIWHNNFINNTVQVKVDVVEYMEPGWVSFWDNGCEGNYWSNYNGTDSDPDGIGDTEYTIDANNTDHYPLMGMFHGYTILWQEETYTVNIISNSTVSGIGHAILTTSQLPNFTIIEESFESIYFHVSGKEGTYGFCRVHIPVALLNGTYRVTVNGTEVPFTILLCPNTTDSCLYFTYTHPTERVEIAPEFPSLPLLMFFTLTLLAVIVYRRVRARKPSHFSQDQNNLSFQA
jgi:parallel beta-helix repeat protein